MVESVPSPRRAPLVALLAAQGISFGGNALAGLALPWFVLATTGSAARVGLVAACALVPQVLAAFFGGAFVDRLGHRRASIVADLASGLTVAAVPLLYALGRLDFPVLLALVFAGAILDAPGATARAALFPETIRLARIRPERANTAHEIVESGAGFAGPILAGGLIALLGPTTVLWGNAASFFVSAALTIACVPSLRVVAEGADATGYREALARGFRFALHDGPIRAIFVIGAPISVLIAPLFAVILPTLFQQSGAGAPALGATVAAFGGGVLGALAYGAVGHRWPRRPTFLIGVVALGASFLVLAAGPPTPVAVAALFLSGLISGPNGPLIPTILQERTPPALRGSVFGATNAVLFAGSPFAVLLAGAALDGFGARPTLLIAAALFAVVTLILVRDRGLRDADRPTFAPAADR